MREGELADCLKRLFRGLRFAGSVITPLWTASVALFLFSKRLEIWFTSAIRYQGQSDKSEIPTAFAARASYCRFF
jgi:hypothetical protein